MRVFWISLAISCAVLTAHDSPSRAAEPQSARFSVEPEDLAAGELAIESHPDALALREARNEEMTSRREQRDDEIDRLTTLLAGGVSAREAHSIHQQIARSKVRAELDLLEIQARHVRLAGRQDVAGRIEKIVASRRERLRNVAPVTISSEPGKE